MVMVYGYCYNHSDGNYFKHVHENKSHNIYSSLINMHAYKLREFLYCIVYCQKGTVIKQSA